LLISVQEKDEHNSKNDTVNDVKKWLGCFGKTRLLCLKQITGHMRRIIYASPAICLNSSIEYFAFNLFRYTFPNENEIYQYTNDGREDDDIFQRILNQNLLNAKKQVINEKTSTNVNKVFEYNENIIEPMSTTDSFIADDARINAETVFEKLKPPDIIESVPNIDSFIYDGDIINSLEKKNNPKSSFLGNIKESVVDHKNKDVIESVKVSVTCETVMSPWGAALKIILKHWNSIFSHEN
jgi:hypothetical protein